MLVKRKLQFLVEKNRMRMFITSSYSDLYITIVGHFMLRLSSSVELDFW